MKLIDLLFPKTCVGCGEWGVYLCPSCVNKLVVTEPACPMCGKKSILGATHGRCERRLGMEGLVSALEYRGLAKKLITKLKYKLVSDLFDDLVEVVISLGDFAAITNKRWLVAAVPLHPRRERWRGFNQAGELGRRLADYFGWEYKDHVLERVRYTKPQVKLSGKQRKENVRGAFRVNANFQKQIPKLKGRRILLVDDVWTSGATMKECAKVLKQAGVRKVWGMVVAS